MVLKSVRIPYKANEKSKYTTRSEQIRSRWFRSHGWLGLGLDSIVKKGVYCCVLIIIAYC